MFYANILLPLKLGSSLPELTYGIPPELQGEIGPGMAVRVPVRNRVYTGIVTKIHEQGLGRELKTAVKDIMSSKEGGKVLEPWQIELAEWMSVHYFTPFYKVLKLMLPERLWNRRRERSERPSKNVPPWRDTLSPKTLTRDQNHIVETILNSTTPPSQRAAQKFLIHGVTGSGKTEIYLRLAEAMSKEGEQTILLVPEISLTPQLIDYFTAGFGGKTAILHSQLSPVEREGEWWKIQKGDATVIIGSRSAVFAPTKNLGLIILDEEHEGSYKQDQTPYYHAREVAFKIAELTGAKVVLGSATPSLETMHAAEHTTEPNKDKPRDIQKFTLAKRINGNETLPPVHLVDMREELRKGNFSMFSDRLIEKLTRTIAAREQAILFLNRRGHSTAVVCRECGQGVKCPHCEVSLTHHRFKNGSEILVCHHCNRREAVPTQCSRCGSVAIKFLGLGTQRVEEELQKRFPTARILRADKDTTSRKGSFKTIYETFKAGDADILLGTQMIGKGLDLPNVTLVGVILADVGMHHPDFRAGERTFQLMTQVAGRSGRAEKPGEVVIQTYNPEHPSLQAAAHHDYGTFYKGEIAARKSLNYPPFSHIVELTYRHEEQKKCSTEALRIAEMLKTPPYAIEVAPSIIPRLHNKYRWHIEIRGENPTLILEQFLQREKLPEGWSIDVDPL